MLQPHVELDDIVVKPGATLKSATTRRRLQDDPVEIPAGNAGNEPAAATDAAVDGVSEPPSVGGLPERFDFEKLI